MASRKPKNLRGRAGRPPRRAGNRKARQLCKQIERALSLVLPDLGSVLSDLYVEQVDPAPDDKHLLVRLAPCPGGPRPGDVEVRQALGQHAAQLRYEATREINRRRAPEISYVYVPPEE